MIQETEQSKLDGDSDRNHPPSSVIRKRKDFLTSSDDHATFCTFPKGNKVVTNGEQKLTDQAYSPVADQERRRFFQEMITDLSKFKTFNEIYQICEDRTKTICKYQLPWPSTDNIPDDAEVDVYSQSIYPLNDPLELSDGFTPIKVLGDGNCLCRTGSLYFFGTENLHIEIRCRMIAEMVLNLNWYIDDDGGDRDDDSNDDKMKEIIFFAREKQWGEMIHLRGLASVMECEVFSIFPKLKNIEVSRKDYHRRIQPRLSKVSCKPLRVFWTRSHDDLENTIWLPNHIVACIQTDSQTLFYQPSSAEFDEGSLEFPEPVLSAEISTDGSFNTCTIDTIQQVIAFQLHSNDVVYDFFCNSPHLIFSKVAKNLRDLWRQSEYNNGLHGMRRIFPGFNNREKKNFMEDINRLWEEYVVETKVQERKKCYCCTEVVSFKTTISNLCDYRLKPNDEDTKFIIPSEINDNPSEFFKKIMEEYLKPFISTKSYKGGTQPVHYEDCENCHSQAEIGQELSPEEPAPMFIIMLTTEGACEDNRPVRAEHFKDIPPIKFYHFEYRIGGFVNLVENETSSSDSESDSNDINNPSGHYIAYNFVTSVNSKFKFDLYKYCNGKGLYGVNDYIKEDEGYCSTILLYRTDNNRRPNNI